MKKKLIVLLSLMLLFVSYNIHNVHADENDTYSYEMKIGDKTTVTAHTLTGHDIIKVDSIGEDLTYWITKVTKNGTEEHTLINTGNKSGVKDSQGRDVLEVQGIETGKGDNYFTVNLFYHAGDDTAQRQEDPNTPEFTIYGLTFATNDFKGIKLKGNKTPDMFDDLTHSNLADLAGTSEENPATQYIYYGETEAQFETTDSGITITNIELVNPDSRVATIQNNKVVIGSPYYNIIPLKITLSDGTVGYLNLEKIGIEIAHYNADVLHVNHGGQQGSALPDDGKQKIVATFYYPSDKSYSNFNLVAKLTYADGTVETKTITDSLGETSCIDTSLKGGDYIIWSGTNNMPIEVSVTAINSGDVTTDDNYAGTLFGSGNGVTWKWERN